VLEPETQEWVASQIFPDLKIMKVRKLAFLVSKDIFSQVFIEQLVEENKVSDVKTMCF